MPETFYLGFMDEEKVFVYHVKGVEVTRFQIIRFKDEGLTNVMDFTFQDFQLEILTRNKVIIYTFNDRIPSIATGSSASPAFNVYLKTDERLGLGEEGEKERNDLQMFAFWRVGLPSSQGGNPSTTGTLNFNLSKGRVVVNGIKELTYIEGWDDNSPQTILDNLFRPSPVRCQTGEVVMKTTTDKSQFFTYYVLKEKDKLV